MDSYQKNILIFNTQLTVRGLRTYYFSHRSRSRPDAYVIIGMGGSGLSDDIVQQLADTLKIKTPIIVWKSYGVPTLHGAKNPFFILNSHSGNTEEVLSALPFIKPGRAAIITSGGVLAGIAHKKKIPLVLLTRTDIEPRQAVGFAFYAILKVIKQYERNIQIPDGTRTIHPRRLMAQGRAIAQALDKKTVLIYTSPQHSHLAYNWKIRLNETSKTPAFIGILPEINHNEIVGFERKPKGFLALFITDSGEHPRIKKRIVITAKLLEQRGTPARIISIPGKNRFEHTWNGIVLGDWVAYSLAKKHKIDPQETKIITEIKRAMRR